MIPPKRIALSGGGMKGIAHIGALEVLQRRGLLKCVREYLGTSAGALVSLCLVIGYTLSELKGILCLLDFSQVQNIDFDTIIQFPDVYGLDDGKNVEKFVGILIRAKGLPDTITFEEFYEQRPTAYNLRVFATNLNTLSVHEFNVKNTPRVSLSFAILASMRIPFLFTPLRDPITDDILVDGALISHSPFNHISDEERNTTIGIVFNTHPSIKLTETTTFVDFIIKCTLSTYKTVEREIFNKWSHRIIDINCDESISINFSIPRDQKELIIQSGCDAANAYFSRAYLKPTRRYSLP
jgi:predicted acylesterase/phospholipase RssA